MSDDPLLNKGELGPYQIEKKLGQGAMGGVYLGLHRVLEVHHAIKVIHPKLLGDDTLLERFLREARNTAKMKHMNIVQVVGADQVEGIYYLAMEFVQGKTLDQLMRDPGLSIHDAVRYVHMTANALQYAHSRNIIHRDIKPANIMVNEEDIAKLMDFGLVRDVGQPEGGESGEQLTMAGYIMGTPQYMPIEQWHGEGVDHRSDIYALGVTLYVALTGKLPFSGRSARDIFRAVLTTSARDVREHNPEIDEQLAGIVAKAIAPEKEDRYQTAEEFALALEQWWDAHPYQGTSLFKAPSMEDATSGAGRTKLQSSSARGRTSSVATRAVLTHGSTGEGSSPGSLDAGGRGRGALYAVAGLVVIIGLAIGAFFAFGGTKQAGNTTPPPPPPPVFEVALDPGTATETLPLAVSTSEFAIPGKGKATVNGKPYEFGTALTLGPGLNKFEVASAAGGQSRILYVLLDTDAPVISIPALKNAEDGVVPTAETTYILKGSVSDSGCGLGKPPLVVSADGEESQPIVDEQGNFLSTISVGNKDVSINVVATDRAGNRQAAHFRLVPDRVPLESLGAWTPASGWVTGTSFTIGGRLSKSRGVEFKVGGKDVTLQDDGSFSVTLEREPGRYEIPYSATDWLGRTMTGKRIIVVDLDAPVIELSSPAAGALRVEKLPATIEVKGKLDSDQAELSINGKALKLAADGSFSTKLTAGSFGEFKVEAKATDPAGRVTSKTLVLNVQQKLYREVGKNEQGYMEYERIKDGMIMVSIPAGEFQRGDASGNLPDAPAQKVKLSAFLIAKYEVSNKQYAMFLTDKGVTADAVQRRWLVKNPDGFFWGLRADGANWSANPGEEERPVVGVTWDGAQAYCKWASKDGSLPSEAQWEYAARGTDGRAYPWGNDFPSFVKANFGSSRDATVEVTKQEQGDSPFGVRNMAGNVEEWCLDWYTEASYELPSQKGTDPAVTTHPSGYDERVVRGGSFRSPLAKTPKPMTDDSERGNLQAYARARRLPHSGDVDRGFRPVANVPAD